VGNIQSYGMNIFLMCIMHTIEKYIHLHRAHRLRHVLAIYLEIPWTWSLGKRRIEMDEMIGTKRGISFNGYS